MNSSPPICAFDLPRPSRVATSRSRSLSPPKTADSVRDIRLPPFVVALLDEILSSHPRSIVFCGARGGFQRGSNLNRRARTPAVAGDPHRGVPAVLWPVTDALVHRAGCPAAVVPVE